MDMVLTSQKRIAVLNRWIEQIKKEIKEKERVIKNYNAQIKELQKV